MRDKNRIEPFCDELARLWSDNSDLCFGQIMSNVMNYVDEVLDKDIFYMEEDELMAIIRLCLRKV